MRDHQKGATTFQHKSNFPRVFFLLFFFSSGSPVTFCLFVFSQSFLHNSHHPIMYPSSQTESIKEEKKKKREKKYFGRLTIEFDLDGFGQRLRELSVGCVAGQFGAQVDSSQTLQLQDVAGHSLLRMSNFGVTVDHPLFLPPRDFRCRVT